MSNEEYKKQLVEQINTINSEKLLKFLCELIQSFKKNWGY